MSLYAPLNAAIELLSMDRAAMEALLETMGQPRYRASQLIEHLKRGDGFEAMNTLPRALREALAERCAPLYPEVAHVSASADGRSEKLLLRFHDGQLIECVFMRNNYGNTLCISTQAGCNMGCLFCASALGGRARDLTSGEMLGQVVLVNTLKNEGGTRGVTNVVLMGSGEPFDNYSNTMHFLKRITAQDGLCISARNISLSTCGLTDAIRTFTGEGVPVTLCVSLHAPDDALRATLMPVARAYPLGPLLEACRAYTDVTGRRVIYEYALIRGVNDAPEHARALALRLKGHRAHVNLIALNAVPERGLAPSHPKAISAFLGELERARCSATLRRSLGGDIEGACGQLRRRYDTAPRGQGPEHVGR